VFSDKWKLTKIGQVLTIGSGRDYKHLNEGDIPVYGTGGIMTMVNDSLYDGDTVCIGRKGTIDKPMFHQGKIWTVDTLFYTHSFINTKPRFVYNLFERINWKLYNEASGVPSLSKATIEKIHIAIPTLPEQQKIASFLSAVDEKIQQLTRKKELLEQYKKGVMQQLFCLRYDSSDSGDGHDGTSNQGNQKNHSKSQFRQLRFKDENGKAYPKWEEKRLGEISNKKSSNIAANNIEANHGTYKIYGASGFLKYVDFYNEEEPFISIVKDGAGVGRTLLCDAKSSVLGTLDIIKPTGKIDLYFLYSVLNIIDFTKYSIGSTIPHIYFKDYSKEKIRIPSFDEQQKIANFLSAIDTKIESVATQIEKTQTFKKGLLQQMFV